MFKLLVVVLAIYFGYNFIYDYYYFPNYKDKYDIGYDMYLDGDTDLPYVYRPYEKSDNEYKKNIGIYVDMNTVEVHPEVLTDEAMNKYVEVSADFTRVTAKYEVDGGDIEAVDNEEVTKNVAIRVSVMNGGFLKYDLPDSPDVEALVQGMGSGSYLDSDVQHDIAEGFGTYLGLKNYNTIRSYLR